MTKQHEQATAKIYQFPARPRATSDSRRQTPKLAQQQAAQVPTAACNNCWYHDEAIEEAEEACEHYLQ
jgi:Protein of unknown function (DUF2735)